MQLIPTPIPDLLIIEPKVFGDERGFFFESFNQTAFNSATGLSLNFVQDNHSKSSKGVLRGLHYQLAPHAQGKLVRVVQGEVWDVAVDIRDSSPTRGQSFGVLLLMAPYSNCILVKKGYRLIRKYYPLAKPFPG